MSNVKIKVDWKSGYLNKKLQQHYNDNIKSIVWQAANDVYNDVIVELSKQGTGKIYKRGSVVHQASVAGAYPATDTGELKDGIKLTFTKSGLTAFIESNAPHSAALEYGTRFVAARPFLFPSLEKMRPVIRKKLKALIAKAKK